MKIFDLKRWRALLTYSIGFVVIVLMIWDLIFSDHGYFVYQGEYEQQQNLKAEIKALQLESQHVKTDIIQLRENVKVLEDVIHRELGYVHPDEYILIMPETKQESPKQIQQRSEDE